MEKIKAMWQNFADKNPKLAQWAREGGLFFLVSCFITLIRGILVTVLKPAFSFMGNEAIGFPRIEMELFGIEFPWYIIGASEEQGGRAYFVALIISMWLCEAINFLMQRKFVFQSNGKMARQAFWYFFAFLIVTCVVNSLSNIWIGVASHFVPPIIYNMGTTFLTGGVAMVVFFFANRIIFKEKAK